MSIVLQCDTHLHPLSLSCVSHYTTFFYLTLLSWVLLPNLSECTLATAMEAAAECFEQV